ncbi:MAG: hypothetical protein EXQ96_03275 [Alphaproteobacteria bacterium]|nr:hypothetical protein [Alphaproteobacteria bacterium]
MPIRIMTPDEPMCGVTGIARRLLPRLAGCLRDRRGSLATYLAIFGSPAVGAGALSIDFGRIAVLRAQMQDSADAAAISAAAQLDGRDGARGRADTVARNALLQTSGLSSNGATLSVQDVKFYLTYGATPVLAVNDSQAKFAEVTLAPRQVTLMLEPLLASLSGGVVESAREMTAIAVAGPKPTICHAPPLMLCDFVEIDPSQDLRDPANVGRQVRLKEPPSSGSATWAPGNFGLLALPDGSVGASDIEGALAAVAPGDCYDIDVITATGAKTNKVKDGINARFDVPGDPWPFPAPNVINYPRDAALIANTSAKLGDGVWDLNGYWAAKHGGAAPPPDLAGASRYQAHLFELGLAFGRNGKATIFPVTDALPAVFTLVTLPGASIPVATSSANANNSDFDGVPSRAVASNGQARRLMQVAQLRCIAENVQGHGTYPTDGNYLEMFITETVKDPPAAAIYGEVVRALTPTNSPVFHSNV